MGLRRRGWGRAERKPNSKKTGRREGGERALGGVAFIKTGLSLQVILFQGVGGDTPSRDGALHPPSPQLLESPRAAAPYSPIVARIPFDETGCTISCNPSKDPGRQGLL